jgi:predicted nucleic-acid-binding protein
VIGLDTNVIVRYLTQDDPVQAAKATALVESLTDEAPGYLTLVALVETVWVLAGRYEAGRAEVARVVEALLRTREIRIEQSETVWQALRLFSASNADFSDCLIERCGHAALCGHTVTFDARAAKSAGMRLIA